jgi:protein-disulfide isomerase
VSLPNRSSMFWYATSFAGGVFVMWGLNRSAADPSATPDAAASAAVSASASPSSAAVKLEADSAATTNPGAVKVELFVMSQCPFGVQAEESFREVVEKMGADVDFRLEFIGEKGPDGKPQSMHGPKEVKGNLVQICAMKHSPAWFKMVQCQNKNWRAVDTNWESCSAELGLPVDTIRQCAEGKEGEELLLASFARAADLGVSGSPTIRIGGKNYEGNRRTADLMRAICDANTGDKPEVCNNIPVPPQVNVTVLTDSRCEACDAKGLAAAVKSKLANPVVTTLDYAEEAGKKLYGEIKPAKLPLLVFDASLDADKEALGMVEGGARKVGDRRVLEVGGDWNPACNDTDGCKLDECKNEIMCREEVPKRLDLFIMSQCPYGVKATDAMKEVLENFKKNGEKIDFAIHYIGSGDDKTGFSSMHGQPEVDEDIRHLCAIEHYKKDFKFLDYIWCRNKDWRSSNWEPCTGKATGIDKAVIEKCFNGDEGKKLLAASFATTNAAGFGASPTWLANNKHQFSGIDPETVKSNICKHNKLAGCDTKLTGMQAPPGAAPRPRAVPSRAAASRQPLRKRPAAPVLRGMGRELEGRFKEGERREGAGAAAG